MKCIHEDFDFHYYFVVEYLRLLKMLVPPALRKDSEFLKINYFKQVQIISNYLIHFVENIPSMNQNIQNFDSQSQKYRYGSYLYKNHNGPQRWKRCHF